MNRRAPGKSAPELAQLGLSQHRAGDKVGAEHSYRAALQRDARNLGALTLLSALLLERREHHEAVALLERATGLAPQHGILHSNLGEALRRSGRLDDALVAFQRAAQASPELAEAHYNLGLTLEQLGRLPEAIAAYEVAASLKPGLAGAGLALLQAMRGNGDFERVLAWYERLAPELPDSAELRCAVAGALADVFRIDEALVHLERALELEPGSARVHADCAAALVERGEVEAALAHLQRAMQLAPENALYHSNFIYLLPFSAATDAQALFRAAADFGRRHTDGIARSRSYANQAEPTRKLRVGYVSPDFRTHPAALFLRPLLREHDRGAWEVFLYSNVQQADAVTQQLRGLADQWRDISRLDDDSAAALIQSDAVDVLVDLAMHSARQRLLLFARKPAPVQLCWLAYPGTTGVAAIDYRVTDPQLDPPELGDAHYSEVSVRLPETFWCYEPLSEEPAVSELPALKNGYVTFASLNSFKKVSELSLALWARLLAAVPHSRLLLVAPMGQARERVANALAQHGVEPRRLELLGHMPRPDYLKAYQRVDVGLDPAPYNGGTTSLDAFWMGVPVVTLPGLTAASRSGASLALNLELPELVARSEQDYVTRAASLAGSLDRLAELRRGLRARMRSSPLMDAPRFARHLEAAYRDVWRRWCDALP